MIKSINTVPENIERISRAIMFRFVICGLCDPMYICNVIAKTNELGNGCGEFKKGKITAPEKTADVLISSYGCNIEKSDRDELIEIIKTGNLNCEKTRTGLMRFINKCKKEYQVCDSWKRTYLTGCIDRAEKNVERIEKWQTIKEKATC